MATHPISALLVAVGRRLQRFVQPAADDKQVILFLAANPAGSAPLGLAEECAEILREIKMTVNREDLQFEARGAVDVDDLMRHITELDPTVIHLSAHGDPSGDLVLQDAAGQPHVVSAEVLAGMIAAAGRRVRVVVLNACYSAQRAEAFLVAAECVVCIDGAIGDAAARAFSVRFYGALGNRRSVGNAVAQGTAALAARPQAARPRCLTRARSAQELYLAAAGEGG